ncbi:hypothetical protein [uncultured Acinetobacter sp.]|uniref:hypothetical protein n=1 Tax=uncultured Acinetobacter sp. TaxID=165433 RepID=UPI002626B304|nr:hypothetical protein [uncultured Acinetobacter sp.]
MFKITPLPIKFECTSCHHLYMHVGQQACAQHYPSCPACGAHGRLLGNAEAVDAVKHPRTFMQSYIKMTLQMLGKIR